MTESTVQAQGGLYTPKFADAYELLMGWVRDVAPEDRLALLEIFSKLADDFNAELLHNVIGSIRAELESI